MNEIRVNYGKLVGYDWLRLFVIVEQEKQLLWVLAVCAKSGGHVTS